jgi:hypothetical protein
VTRENRGRSKHWYLRNRGGAKALAELDLACRWSRHGCCADHIHAVASVFIDHVQRVARGEREATDSDDAYYVAVEKLTVENWLAQWEDGDDKRVSGSE